MTGEHEAERGRRIVKAGRRRAVSRPDRLVEQRIDPTLDDRADAGSAAGDRGAGADDSHDAWLREQRPPHWE